MSDIHSIIIFTADECNWCDNLRQFLKTAVAKVEPKTFNISQDEDALSAFKEHGFRTVPQVFINGRHIGGHDAALKYLKDLGQ